MILTTPFGLVVKQIVLWEPTRYMLTAHVNLNMVKITLQPNGGD